MARELVLEVVARKNSRELNALADDFDKLARKSDSAGKSLGRTASFSQHLDKEIANTRQTIRELGQEFDRTGNKDVFAKLRGAQANLRGLERIRGDLSKAFAIAGEESAQSFLQRFARAFTPSSMKQTANNLVGSLSGALSSAGPLWIVGGATAVAAAPTIGAMIGAGILTGVGLAGIGAGIAGQLHDPAIEKAAAALGKQVSVGFKDSTSAFQKPILDGLGVIAAEFDRIQPGLKSTFSQLAPFVVTLSHGAAGFVDKLVPGLERAALASRPLIQDFSVWLPKLGSELSNFFSAIASHEAEARQGLHILTGTLDILISQLTTVTNVGAEAFKWGVPEPTKEFFDWLAKGNQFDGVIKSLDSTGTAAQDATAQMQKLQQQIGATAVTADSLAANMTDKVFASLMGVDQANLSVAQSLTQVTDALKTNKRSLDIHRAAGQADISAILGAVQANIQQYDALIQAGAGADQATAAYNQNTAALESQLRKAGLTQRQIDGLIGKYKNVPNTVNTNIAIQGLTDAINNLTDLIKMLNGIHDKHVNVYYTEYVSTRQGGRGPSANKPIPNAIGGVMYAAAQGMIFPASNPPLVRFAEPQTGGEAYIPRLGIPAARGLALADTAASWYGGAVVPRALSRAGRGGSQIQHTLRVADGGDVAVGTMIRYLLRTGALTIDSEWVT